MRNGINLIRAFCKVKEKYFIINGEHLVKDLPYKRSTFSTTLSFHIFF